MENEMTMINVEENNVEMTEGNSTVGEKALVMAVVVGGVAAVGAAVYGIKKLAGKIKSAWHNRKNAGIIEGECTDLGEVQADSEEESD